MDRLSDEARKRPSRIEQRHQETREEILREAQALIEERGAADLSMRELAECTRFTPPALYRYFPGGKEDVLGALATSSLLLLMEHLRHVPDDLPPMERLTELAMVYLEFAREHRRELNLMLDTVSASTKLDFDDDIPQDPSGLFGVVFEALGEAAKAGEINASNPEQLMIIFHGVWSLVHGMAVLERIHPHHETLLRTNARNLIQAYLDGLSGDWLQPAPASPPKSHAKSRTPKKDS